VPTSGEEESVDGDDVGSVVRLLALQDEVDRLRGLPSAVGFPGLVLFIVVLSLLVANTDLGVLRTFLAGLLVGSPGLILVAKDLRLARRIGLLECQIHLIEEESVARRALSEGADGTLHLDS